MHTNLALTALAASTFVGGVAAQSIVVPSIASTEAGNTFLSYAFYSTSSTTESHMLSLFDSADISVGGGFLKSVQIRRPASLGNTNQAATFTLKVDMSLSKQAANAIQANFAANHDTATKVTVFNGTLNLPMRSRGTWPEPWEAKIPFSSNFTWVKPTATSLAIELTSTGNTSGRPWYVEGYAPKQGTRVTELSPSHCRHSGNASNNSISYRFPTLGSSWFVRHNGMPENTPTLAASVNTIGAQGAGGTYGGMTLPITLSALGIAVQPGCKLANDILVTLPMTYTTSTRTNGGSLTSPNIALPNNPWLVGQVFYSQPICLDTDSTTQQPLVYMGWASKWTIGSGAAPAGSTVYRIGGNTNPTGIVRRGTVPSMRFDS